MAIDRIRDHVFLITGGGSGLGAACARMFVERGAKVVIGDIARDPGEQLAKELGGSARFSQLDVVSAESVSAALAAARSAFNRLDGAVHCAGILGGGRLVGKEGPHDLDAFRRIVEVNLVGTFNVMRLVAADMAKNEPDADGQRGVIVTTSSVAAFEGQIGQAAYSASKGGVASMTLPAARELARFGIRVVSVAPGVFATPMVEALPPEAQQGLVAAAAFPPRLGRPAEFASLVCQIVENPMLNGTVVRLDAGLRMPAR